MSMFLAALFTIATKWKQPKRSADEWINKNVVYIDNGVLFSLQKEGSSDASCNIDEP